MNQPCDWRRVCIHDVTLPTRPWNPQAEPRDTIRYIDVSAVSRERLQIVNAEEVSAAFIPSRARKIIKENDTIFATIRPGLKRVAKVPPAYDDDIASTAFCILRPDKSVIDPDFLYFVASSDAFVEEVAGFETGASYPAVRDRDILARKFFLPPISDQILMSSVLNLVRDSVLLQVDSIAVAMKFKDAAMRALFTRGLRGEARKETEIGLLPESWEAGRLDQYADVISTRMAYSELETAETASGQNGIRVLGIKVGDMNRAGNEVGLSHAELEKILPKAVAERRCAPPRTIIFPKRGAAIATNKKRISHEWTVFDPNVIGVIALEKIEQDYLFQWFQGFDLRTITEPGPTPQLNKKNLEPLIVPVPPTLVEQKDIALILGYIDHKIDLHRSKLAILDDLFKALLYKLVTGEIRVGQLDLSALSPAAPADVAA